jgi:hypothetical protein
MEVLSISDPPPCGVPGGAAAGDWGVDPVGPVAPVLI